MKPDEKKYSFLSGYFIFQKDDEVANEPDNVVFRTNFINKLDSSRVEITKPETEEETEAREKEEARDKAEEEAEDKAEEKEEEEEEEAIKTTHQVEETVKGPMKKAHQQRRTIIRRKS